MTDLGPPIPPDRQLGAADIRGLFDLLSSHLRDAGSTGHHLMIAGGAALALMWEDRTTHDIDVLEHRFRAPPQPDSERRTTAVDFISMRFPAGELHPQVLHQTDCLTVEAPSPTVLLAMKLHAARGLDLQDAARLARDTNITDPDHLLALVEDAYGADTVTAETDDFAHRALSLARRETRSRHQPPDRGLSAGL